MHLRDCDILSLFSKIFENGFYRFSSADLTKLVAVAVNTVRTGAVAKRVLKQMEASEKVNIKDLVFKTDYRPITEVSKENTYSSVLSEDGHIKSQLCIILFF